MLYYVKENKWILADPKAPTAWNCQFYFGLLWELKVGKGFEKCAHNLSKNILAAAFFKVGK